MTRPPRPLLNDFVTFLFPDEFTTFLFLFEGDETHADFRSRFFAPGLGIDEDPVTGSAHSCLAPYWASKLGRRVLFQCFFFQSFFEGSPFHVLIGKSELVSTTATPDIIRQGGGYT